MCHAHVPFPLWGRVSSPVMQGPSYLEGPDDAAASRLMVPAPTFPMQPRHQGCLQDGPSCLWPEGRFYLTPTVLK